MARRRTHAALASVVGLLCLLLTASPTAAIIGGQPDGNRHPYVGLVTDYVWVCSGSLVSPTLFITAAHCFEQPGQAVEITFDEAGFAESSTFHTGTWHPDPDFCIACDHGLVGFATHDLAVVVLDQPVALERYAELPDRGGAETVSKKQRLGIVGYGLQDQAKQLDPGELFTRYRAEVLLSPGKTAIGDDFLKLSANQSKGKGGVCFGDSGGPVLKGDTILGVNSFGTNRNCAGHSYAYRIDTAEALAFIAQYQ